MSKRFFLKTVAGLAAVAFLGLARGQTTPIKCSGGTMARHGKPAP